jgi:hypothetical protein
MLATLYHEIGLRSQIPMSNDLKGHGRRSPPYAFAGSFIVGSIYRISLGICEKAAENGVLSTAPQTREPRCFKHVLASCAKLGRF